MKKIGTIFIIVGAILLLLVGGITLYSEYKYNSLMDGYVSNDGNTIENEESSSIDMSMPSDTIGIIEIPEIELKNPILDGVSNKVLRTAVGRFTESQPLGTSGTTTLIGHNKFILNQPFKRLDELTEGSIVNIITNEKTYVYEVVKTYIVKPYDTSVLDYKGYPALVMITCTDDAKERYVVEAKMVNPEEASDIEEIEDEDLENEDLEDEDLEDEV